MTGVVIVTGTPGAGKTTIIGSVANKNGYKVVNIGSLMLELAKDEKSVKDRDDLKHVSHKSYYADLRNNAFSKIEGMEGDIIVDTHASVEAEGTGRFIPGLPMESLKIIKNLRGFIYIDAHTDRILERRRMDKT